MFDYEKIGYTAESKVVNPQGMTRVRYVKDRDNGKTTLVVSEFNEQHPMYKKYGIREMEAAGYGGDKPNRFYKLTADVLGDKNIELKIKPGIFEEINPLEQMKKLLKSLNRASKYKQTSFLNNVLSVTQYIRK